MPLYEYKCDQCEEVFEVIQKFSDAPVATHDKCGGAVRRLVSAPAIQFKGTGWYITDYARPGSESGKGKNGTSSAGSEAKGETTTQKSDAPAKS